MFRWNRCICEYPAKGRLIWMGTAHLRVHRCPAALADGLLPQTGEAPAFCMPMEVRAFEWLRVGEIRSVAWSRRQTLRDPNSVFSCR